MAKIGCRYSIHEVSGKEDWKPTFPQMFHPWKLTWNLKMKVWKMIFLFNWVISGSMLILQGVSESSGMKLRTQFTRLTIPVNSTTFNREPCHLTARLFHPVDAENDGCPCKERTLRGLEIGDMPPQIFQWNYETLSGVAAISAFQIKQDFATKSLILADIPPAPKWGCWLLTDPRCWFTLQACPTTFHK